MGMDCFQVSMGAAELALARELVARELDSAKDAGADEERVRLLRELVVALECADDMF